MNTVLAHGQQANQPHDAESADVAERTYVESLIRRIVDRCPRRAPGSQQERQAQRILCRELTIRGGIPAWQRFPFSSSLYAVIAVHFTVAVVGSAVFFFSPFWAAILHATAAVSYVGDSSRWYYFLRRFTPRCRSQNLVVTFPAQEPVRRRLVVVGHADAAPTGWLFHPWLMKWSSAQRCPRFLRFLTKPLLMAVLGFVIVAALDADAWWRGVQFPRRPVAFFGFTFYFAVAALLNWQIVWRKEIVPGANDNLSSCAALPVLAQRLANDRPDDVEIAFVVTGCEEAGTGGALAQAQRMRPHWRPDETRVLVLEVIGSGEPRIFREGELWPIRVPDVMLSAAREATIHSARFATLSIFQQPAGATDALPFLRQGIPAMALGCIDEATGVPGNYHWPSDTPDHLDYQQLMRSIDLAEAILRRLMAEA